MLSLIGTVFSLICFIILTTVWILTSSVISYCLYMILKSNSIRPNPVAYSILLGIALEVILSAVSLLIMRQVPEFKNNMDIGILLGLQRGYGITVLLSPVSSIVGAILGVKKSKRPPKNFF